MKQKFFLLLAILGVAIVANAQSQIATLSHNDTISTFYGAEALQDAYEQAVDGDIITLSAGSFLAVDFEKRITVKGAGMGIQTDSLQSFSAPTIITGEFHVRAEANDNYHFTLEGICHEGDTMAVMTLKSIYKAQFVKCKFYNVKFEKGYGSDNLRNCNFIHCYVSNSFSSEYESNITFNAVSSCFCNAYLDGESNLFTFTNCIIKTEFVVRKAALKNCIIVGEDYNHGYKHFYSETSNIYYSLWAGNRSHTNPFYQNTLNHHDTVLPEGTDPFVANTFFKLTEETKKYLGSDGTEVGIYGGSLPFDPTPSSPQITKFDVAPKTSADGKLSVDITVEQPE